eukprot:gene12712-biopygen6364
MLWSIDLEVALLDRQWLTVGDFRASLGSERGPSTLEGIIARAKGILSSRHSTLHIDECNPPCPTPLAKWAGAPRQPAADDST